MFQLFVVWWWAYLCFTLLGSTVTIVHTSGLALLVNWTRNRQTVSRSRRAVFNITQNSRGEWHRQTYCTWQLAQQYCRVRAHMCSCVVRFEPAQLCGVLTAEKTKTRHHSSLGAAWSFHSAAAISLTVPTPAKTSTSAGLPYCHAPVSVGTLVIKPTQGWNHKVLQMLLFINHINIYMDWLTYYHIMLWDLSHLARWGWVSANL